MNRAELQKIISEAVKKAVKEELREIILEAVEIASRPEEQQVISRSPAATPILKKDSSIGIAEMLSQTAKTMTGEDYKNVLGSGNIVESNLEMITTADVNKLPSFVKRAGEIYKASNKIKR